MTTKIEINLTKFLRYFRYLHKCEPKRVVFIDNYFMFLDSLIKDEIIKSCSENSKIVINFKNNNITIDMSYKTYGEKVFRTCNIEVVESETLTIEYYSDFIKEVYQYLPTVDHDKNEILLCIDDEDVFKPLVVQSLKELYIPPNSIEGCKNKINASLFAKEKYDNCHKKWKCNVLICGDQSTGKYSLVKALALEYKRPLQLITLIEDACTTKLLDIFENVPYGTMICLRDCDVLVKNISLKHFIFRLLDSELISKKGCILFCLCANPNALTKYFFDYNRIDYIVKLDNFKKNELKSVFFVVCKDATEEMFKTFYGLMSNKQYTIGMIYDYLLQFSNSSSEEAIKNIQILEDQHNLRKDLFGENSEKLYN